MDEITDTPEELPGLYCRRRLLTAFAMRGYSTSDEDLMQLDEDLNNGALRDLNLAIPQEREIYQRALRGLRLQIARLYAGGQLDCRQGVYALPEIAT